MALSVRKTTDTVLFALVASFNALKRELAAQLTTMPHADVSSKASTGDYHAPVAGAADIDGSAAATDLASTIARANSLKAVYNRTIADADAHKAADAGIVAVADTTDLASAETLLNAIKTAYAAHRVSTAFHFTADDVNAVAAPDASDLASAEALANDLHAQINAHIQAGFAAPSIKLIEA
jgi:hypothetical protein